MGRIIPDFHPVIGLYWWDYPDLAITLPNEPNFSQSTRHYKTWDVSYRHFFPPHASLSPSMSRRPRRIFASRISCGSLLNPPQRKPILFISPHRFFPQAVSPACGKRKTHLPPGKTTSVPSTEPGSRPGRRQPQPGQPHRPNIPPRQFHRSYRPAQTRRHYPPRRLPAHHQKTPGCDCR